MDPDPRGKKSTKIDSIESLTFSNIFLLSLSAKPDPRGLLDTDLGLDEAQSTSGSTSLIASEFK